MQHKRNHFQAENVQQLKSLTPGQFFECLRVSDDLFPSDITDSHRGLSIDDFCSLANHIAESIQERHFPNDDLLVFKDTGNKTPNRHITGTKCRPDITAAFEKDWITDDYTDWALIRLAGERASKDKSQETQRKNAATYLHYLLLARPDFLVAQGLLIATNSVLFLVGIGGVGIRKFKVNKGDKDLYKFIYAFIYRMYDPSHFADPTYARTGFKEETSEASYTVHFKMKECSDFRTVHATNPFTTRTHVLSNPSLTQGDDRFPPVIKEQLCRTGRRFDELTILTKIHQPVNVPGVVQAVGGEIITATLSPRRVKHRLGLRQTGSPFTTIPTAKIMLETLLDLLEVLRFLRFKRRILHRDVSMGNVMYIENPEIPAQEAVEPLIFAKYLLGESKVRHETSLLLVDFNLGEDLEDKKDEKRTERTGTPIFISRAVDQGEPVPLDTPYYVPGVPKTPECYANAHPERKRDFSEGIERLLVDPDKLENHSQDDRWRHELDHDVESVFWLLLYWAMVAQPKERPEEHIDSVSWASLLKDVRARECLVFGLSFGQPPVDLIHSVYEPLWPLIRSLAAMLVVDSHWLPESDVRKRPEYICEAFQRLILGFIVSEGSKDFMTCRVGDSLRQVYGVAQSQALSTTTSQRRDRLERQREAKRQRRTRTNLNR